MLARMATRKPGKIFVGIGGWNFKPWRDNFYPESLPQKQELAYASSKVTSIEINSTFYGPQKPATFQRWHDETPDDFVFAVKAPRFATNRRDLTEAGDSIKRFVNGGMLKLGSKLGPINWQLAPTKKFDAEEIKAFLALLPDAVKGQRLRHAIEVRNPSFATPAFIELARKRGVAIVLAGDSAYPEIDEATAPFAYARIMGTVATQKAGYAAAALTRWAKRAQSLAAGSRDVYLYVISGAKERNPAAAQALIKRLS
jgi:uncharacterized protein YecE (DUF72 family)